MSSTTAQHAIQQALVAALLAAPAVASGAVHTNRARPISAQQPTAVAVRLERTEGNTATLGAVDWRTTYTVECYTTAPASADPAQAVDALLAAVWARLAALQPAAVGQGLMDLQTEPAIAWDYEDGTERTTVCATLRVTATHRTTPQSLAPWA